MSQYNSDTCGKNRKSNAIKRCQKLAASCLQPMDTKLLHILSQIPREELWLEGKRVTEKPRCASLPTVRTGGTHTRITLNIDFFKTNSLVFSAIIFPLRVPTHCSQRPHHRGLVSGVSDALFWYYCALPFQLHLPQRTRVLFPLVSQHNTDRQTICSLSETTREEGCSNNWFDWGQ